MGASTEAELVRLQADADGYEDDARALVAIRFYIPTWRYTSACGKPYRVLSVVGGWSRWDAGLEAGAE